MVPSMLGQTVTLLPPEGMEGYNVGIVVGFANAGETMLVRAFNHRSAQLDQSVEVSRHAGQAHAFGWRWQRLVHSSIAPF